PSGQGFIQSPIHPSPDPMTTPNAPPAPYVARAPATGAPGATNTLVAERREKLAAIRAQGVGSPNDCKHTHHAPPMHAAQGANEGPELEAQGIAVKLAGRLMLKRVMGKACFGTLQEGSGRMQAYITLDAVGAETLNAFKHWDLGDILGVEGTL